MLKAEQLIIKHLFQIRNEVRELRVASKEVLTIKEVMIYTGFSKSYIYRLINEGKIEYSKPNGKSIFFDRKTLEKWLLSKSFSSINKNKEKATQFLRK